MRAISTNNDKEEHMQMRKRRKQEMLVGGVRLN